MKHFVTFFSPGTFFAETNEVEVDSWDVQAAVAKAKTINQRYNAKPYGFQFKTVELVNNGWDKKVTKTSNMYFLGGQVLTLEQIKAKNDPKDEILISNMENNGYDRVIENSNSYKITLPIRKGDIVL